MLKGYDLTDKLRACFYESVHLKFVSFSVMWTTAVGGQTLLPGCQSVNSLPDVFFQETCNTFSSFLR